jgi:hypothetical protein
MILVLNYLDDDWTQYICKLQTKSVKFFSPLYGVPCMRTGAGPHVPSDSGIQASNVV